MARELTTALVTEAKRLGFTLVGVCAAEEAWGAAIVRDWVAAGRHAAMGYFPHRIEAYRHPTGVLPETRSLLMLGVGYSCPAAERATDSSPPPGGILARFARSGVDYHDWIRSRLRQLVALHRRLAPTARVRGVVDTAPLLEREFAARAGLGAIGKNTLLIHPRLGSWFVLAALLTTESLHIGEPPVAAKDLCGTCRACLDACPTHALVAPYALDARRCLSYWTLEHIGVIPPDIARAMGSRLFGCDTCQEACPWNRSTETTAGELGGLPEWTRLDPIELLRLDMAGFSRRFTGTSLARAGRSRLLRNAAIVLANRWRDLSSHHVARHSDADRLDRQLATEALTAGLADNDEVVGATCRWALEEMQVATSDSH